MMAPTICCEKWEGDHPHVNCPFCVSKSYDQHSRETTPSRNKQQQCWGGLLINLRNFVNSVQLKTATQSMPSASLHPSGIDQYLLTELEKGRVAGLYSISPIPNLHVIHFGVIPKKYQPRKWRLILDISTPMGHSVNRSIPREPFSLQYLKVDNVINMVMSYGWGALMAKFDVESAYHNVPVHSDDCYLLSMKWQSNYFIGMAVPFELHSRYTICLLFYCKPLEWILKHNHGVQFLLHFLDDFHT